MSLFTRSLRMLPIGLFVGIAFLAPGAAGQSSDNSVWYSSPNSGSQPSSSPAPAPQPSPQPHSHSQSGSSITYSGGYYSGGRYYSFGGGSGNRIIIRYGNYGYSYPSQVYGRYYWPRDYRYYRRYDSPDTSTLIELARRYDPNLIGADPNAEPPTARKLGEAALRAGEYERAITEFAEATQEEVAESGDGEQSNRQAQRLLGIAYAAAKQFDQAGTQLTEAYEADPNLRTLPIRGDDLFPSGLELNSIVSRAVGHAHRHPSYNSWFTVAVLMQAQGKNDLANTMIERAEAARAKENTGSSDENTAAAVEPKQAEPERPRVEPVKESEADRLRRELERSMERMLESQRRLDELKRKQAEAEQEQQESSND